MHKMITLQRIRSTNVVPCKTCCNNREDINEQTNFRALVRETFRDYFLLIRNKEEKHIHIEDLIEQQGTHMLWNV